MTDRGQESGVRSGVELGRDPVVDDSDFGRIHARIGAQRRLGDAGHGDDPFGVVDGVCELPLVAHAQSHAEAPRIQQRRHVVDGGYERHRRRRWSPRTGHVQEIHPGLLDKVAERRMAAPRQWIHVRRNEGKGIRRRNCPLLLVLAEHDEFDTGIGEMEQQVPRVRAYASVPYRPGVEPNPHAASRRPVLANSRALNLNPSPTEIVAEGPGAACTFGHLDYNMSA